MLALYRLLRKMNTWSGLYIVPVHRLVAGNFCLQARLAGKNFEWGYCDSIARLVNCIRAGNFYLLPYFYLLDTPLHMSLPFCNTVQARIQGAWRARPPPQKKKKGKGKERKEKKGKEKERHKKLSHYNLFFLCLYRPSLTYRGRGRGLPPQ